MHARTYCSRTPPDPELWLSTPQDIAAYFKMSLGAVVHVKDRAFNDRRYYIGSDKLSQLGWKERVGWEEGLKRTIEW